MTRKCALRACTQKRPPGEDLIPLAGRAAAGMLQAVVPEHQVQPET